MDISCHNSENWPKEMATNWRWNWRLTVLKTIKMMLVRPTRTDFKMTIRANCVVSQAASCPACARLRFPFKSTCPLISKREFVLWNMNPPSPQGCQLPQQSNLSFYPTVVSQYWILEWWAADSVIWNLGFHGGLRKWEGYGLVWYGSSHRGVWGSDGKNYEAETRLWTNSTFY